MTSRNYPYNNSLFLIERNNKFLFDSLQLRFLLFLQGSLNKFITQLSLSADTYVIHINGNYLLPFMFFMRFNSMCNFTVLTDLAALDVLAGYRRFFICYNLLSLRQNVRVLVKIRLNDDDAVKSLTPIYVNANWLEREAWDMFGIFFYNHPDLRRILTDYGFEAHPLRKDFPLTGFKEVSYSDKYRMIIRKKVSLAQEYRVYFFNNPWRSGGSKVFNDQAHQNIKINDA